MLTKEIDGKKYIDTKTMQEAADKGFEERQKVYSDRIRKEIEKEQKMNDAIGEILSKAANDIDKHNEQKMLIEIEQAKSIAEAEVRARYTQHYGDKEWNSTDEHKAYKDLVKRLLE